MRCAPRRSRLTCQDMMDDTAGGTAAIERLDPAGAADGDLAAVHAVHVACYRVWGGADLLRTSAELAAWVRYPAAFEWRGYWIARDASGDVAGFASAGISAHSSTPHLHELLVAPDRRHRGLGRRLLAAVTAECVTRGGRTLHGAFIEPDGERFARAAGARTGNRLRLSVLQLPADLPAPRPVPGCRLQSWVGATPHDVLNSYARARNAINDAPNASEAGATQTWTSGRVRDLEAAVARRGHQSRVTVAVDGAGEVVGHTELRVGPEPGTVARIEDSAVVAAHRGRGLARHIKLESLRRLAADRPDVRAVITGNDITNTPMLAVNTALGFIEMGIQTDAFLLFADAR